ncbi:MAG: hypothetical protein DI537_17540 [Stutzerimonas stutzeri]|nr:MAG: hypothetical protein DI537_17540 [Stutzerimonas stutzeri]
MPGAQSFEAFAAAALLQGTLIWVALRYGGCFLYMHRFFRTMDRKDRRFLSTGSPQVDRYLVLSTVTIGSIITLIVSMVLNREIEAWVSMPILLALIAVDIACFRSVANQRAAEIPDSLRDPFEENAARIIQPR